MSRQPPVSRVGEFHVLDFVGAGGMGEVFRAVHARTGQVAAVKFLTGNVELSPDARAKWRERFIHEARVQSSLRHPNLTAFYEWHEIGSIPCIVMELVDGQTLSSRIQHGALSISEALAIFGRVVDGVAFMHQSGVIHRDIKSGNVKITAKGEVKLLDFGISKTGDTPRLTTTGAFVGTLQYLSPEQIKGANADTRCDVWALGALFYEILSGKAPFDAPTWGELVEKVTKAHYEPLHTHLPNIPREVETIVRRCLQKQPNSRFANAGELSLALQKLSSVNANVPDKQKAVAPFNDTPSKLPIFALGGGAGALLLAGVWLLWPASPIDKIAVQPTPAPIEIPTPRTELSSNQSEEDWKNLTVDVFEGASQTKIYRDNQFISNAPCELRGRIGEEIDLKLSRPGFQDRYETITVTQSRSVYSFNMEPLSR